MTEFAWLLSPKPVDAWVRPAWPRGTASSLEGRIAEEAEARDGAPGLTSAAERVPAERARGRPQQRQGSPGERSRGRAPSAHPGRRGTCLPPWHLWRQRCARGLGLGGGSGPSVRALPGAPRSVPARTPTAVARARAGSRPPRAGLLFLVGAALPVGQTEPVNSAVEEGPVRGAPRKGGLGPAES